MGQFCFTDTDESMFIFYDRETASVKAIPHIEEKQRIVKAS